MVDTSAYEKYWAANRYYLALTESANVHQRQAYSRKAAIARRLANASLINGDEFNFGFYANRFNVTLATIRRDVREINAKAKEPDLVARVRASLK